MKKEFEAATGATLSVFQGNTGQVLARLDAEKSRPQADVVILADWSAAIDMAGKGQVQALSPKGIERVPARFKDAGNMYVAQGISALGLGYNTASPAPKEWEDLTGPDWKDKITMPDPAQSGSAYDFLAGLLQNLGDDKGWALFTAMRANGIEVPGTNDAAINPVVTGAKRGVLAGVDYLLYARIKNNEPVGIVYPASGTVVSPRPMVLLKEAPNADGGKAFVEYMLSDQGQAQVIKTLLLPAREDLKADPSRAQLADIKALPVDYAKSIAQRDAILGRFASQVAR
jgi:iron(III) transport system substrate-binding protein